ncbi:hypothetical protein [Aminivibrio sp.]|uniref:hypothetical protein n=1 Tax=Aminivibrio sp. TaxID=1872489 RepID=UPI001A362E91|nr:hypothetical protein [Aminivibrio sp.]MBL3539351.1 hypothetical protein [Aminivibrio sp.]
MRLFAALCIIIASLAVLPGISFGADVKALLSEANALFRSADKDFMSGKMDSAWESVTKAKETITAAKEADPSNSQVTSLEKRIDQLAVKIEKRRGSSSQAAPAGKPASPAAAPKRLPATAGRYLMEADRALKRAETILGPDRDKQDPARLPARVREALAPAEENLGKLLAEYPDFSDHPDVTPKVERLEAAWKELNALESAASASKGAEEAARAEREKMSGEWLKKLRPFVASKSRMDDAPYLDPEKEMVSYAGFDISAEELARRHRIHGEAAAALEEYRNAGVKEPLELLAETAKEIERRLGEFSASLEGLGRTALDEAKSQLEWGRAFTAENLPKAERGEDFNILSRDVLLRIQNSLDQAAVFLPKDDPDLVETRTGFARLEEEGTLLREKRVEKTRLLSEKFGGSEGEAIREAVAAAIRSEHPGAEVLRVNIVSPAWKEEWRFQEGADRVLRLTATRQVTVQAAVKKSDGVFMLTLGAYSPKNPDWTWGPVKGYVMFSDKMLEENVNK